MKKLMKLLTIAVWLISLIVHPVTTSASGVGKVTGITNWKQIEITDQGGDGVRYQITWKKVKGANGYQVKFYEKGYPEDTWYTWTQFTKKTRAHLDFSSCYAIKGKVRAYKVIDGKKVYGEWSKSVKCIVDY